MLCCLTEHPKLRWYSKKLLQYVFWDENQSESYCTIERPKSWPNHWLNTTYVGYTLYNAASTVWIVALTTCKLWAIDRPCFQSIMMKTGMRKQQEYHEFLTRLVWPLPCNCTVYCLYSEQVLRACLRKKVSSWWIFHYDKRYYLDLLTFHKGCLWIMERKFRPALG